jgi:hypothetical protein
MTGTKWVFKNYKERYLMEFETERIELIEVPPGCTVKRRCGPDPQFNLDFVIQENLRLISICSDGRILEFRCLDSRPLFQLVIIPSESTILRIRCRSHREMDDDEI